MSRFYVTTPIYYVNDAPHIGHAYTTLACDVLARFMRSDGHDVRFLTGTDEHGQKVEKAAAAKGIDPQSFTDEISQNFRHLADFMNFSYDDFIRTTEPRHITSCQAIWKAIADRKSPQGRNNIYLDKYAGWYAVRDEAFYTEAELEDGPGGKKIGPTGAEVEWVEEPSYFFRLSDWQNALLEFYDANPDFIAPTSRRNEVINFVKGGLNDLSISRTTFSWGVPVPGDEDHIMYVWLDALTNYITAVCYPNKEDQLWEYWPANLHMVGKDILRFHAVYWPAFLMAAGLEPPQRVFAHGWWTNEGQKISKSVGNVIDPIELVERYGLDPIRYFLLRQVPFGNDGDFSHQAMVHRLNGDLANDLGNLCQRVMSMVFKNCDGKIPESHALQESDIKFVSAISESIKELRQLMAAQSFNQALELIWRHVAEANRYVDEQAPWALRKTDQPRMETVLYTLTEAIRNLAILTTPFMPQSMAMVFDQLSVPKNHRDITHLGLEYAVDSGAALPGKPAPIFPRFVDDEEG